MAATWGGTAVITLPTGETIRKRYLKLEVRKRGAAKRLIEQLAEADYPEAINVTVNNVNEHYF